MGQWRRSGVVVESSAAPKMIQGFGRPARLKDLAGAFKQLIHADALGADYYGGTAANSQAIGDSFETDLYLVGNESRICITTGKGPTMGAWDLYINGTQQRNWSAISGSGKYWNDDGGAWTDDTVDAGDAGYDDIIFLPAVPAVNDATYFGWPCTFSGIMLLVSQAAIGGTIVWEYWNGAAWASIPGLVDTSAGLTLDGTQYITFTPPSNWAANLIGANTIYWVRIRVAVAAFTQQPTGHQVFLDPGYDEYAAATGMNNRYISGLSFFPGYNLIEQKIHDNNISSTNLWLSVAGISVQE